jgi:hypothetical protein
VIQLCPVPSAYPFPKCRSYIPVLVLSSTEEMGATLVWKKSFAEQ